MSWEAVTWANRQKLKKSYEQIVLLVLANCADPNGEAFVKWPGRDHWWVYLSERTRLPKSSLFRHLNTLVALGLGERAMQVLADGSKRPTFKLNMAACFDIDLPEDEQRYNAATSRTSGENQSPVETEHDDHEEHDENDSDISHSQEGEAPIAPQSPVETGNSPGQSPVGTEPVPVLGTHKDSKPFPKNSPLPPSGGASVSNEGWQGFLKVWREPMPKMALAKHAWDHIPTEKHGEATAAAAGYFAWLAKHPKPPAAVSAQSFLRDHAGWAQWLRYAPDATGAIPVAATAFARDSVEAKALLVLHEIAGKADFFRQVHRRGDGTISYPKPVSAQLAALAQAAPQAEWVTLSRQQAGAWEGLLREAVVVQVRNRLCEGSRAPWAWPPSAEGKLYTSATGPPEVLMTEQDFSDFK